VKIRTSGYQTLYGFYATLPTGRLVHVGETFFAELQILGRELHKNAFGGRALPGPAEGAITLPELRSRYKGKGGKGRKRLVIGGEGMERKDANG